MALNPKLLQDDRLATDGIRAPGRQHPVQRRHADGSLSLLGREAAGSQTRSDQRLGNWGKSPGKDEPPSSLYH
jgi:hypothetical protein